MIRMLLAALAGLTLVTGTADADVSSRRAGFQLLREGAGARAAALGEAFVAVADDQGALAWNPAAAASLVRKDFVVSHQSGIADVRRTYAGWGTGNGSRGLGLSFGIHTTGGIEARTDPTAEPAGMFHLFEMNAALTYAQRLFGGVHGGFSAHYLHEDIASARASGFGLDFGLLVTTRFSGLTLGASARNLGRMDELAAERVPLPRAYRAGVALRRSRLLLTADGRFPERGGRGVSVGAEAEAVPGLSLRAGYQTGRDTRDLSFGFGLTRRNWRIDYAFVPQDLGLGSAHRISIGIR